MEAAEVREFSEQLQDGAEKRLTHVSVIIAALAVVVALVTVLGHRAHTQAILEQTRTADQWNEYQAHKVRLQQAQIATDLLTLQPTKDPAATQAKLASYKTQMAKWQAEIDKEAEAANRLEDRVESDERVAARFDLGEALLQISLVLASITLLTRQQRYVLAALLIAAGGIAVAASAFLVK